VTIVNFILAHSQDILKRWRLARCHRNTYF